VKKKNSTKVKDLENKIKNAKQIKEKELKDAEQDVTKTKKKMEESSKKMKTKSQVSLQLCLYMYSTVGNWKTYN